MFEDKDYINSGLGFQHTDNLQIDLFTVLEAYTTNINNDFPCTNSSSCPFFDLPDSVQEDFQDFFFRKFSGLSNNYDLQKSLGISKQDLSFSSFYEDFINGSMGETEIFPDVFNYEFYILSALLFSFPVPGMYTCTVQSTVYWKFIVSYSNQ